MKRIPVSHLLLILALVVPGCVKNPSAIDQLTEREDPLELMKIPPKAKPETGSAAEQKTAGDAPPASPAGDEEDIDLSPLRKLKEPKDQPWVKVTGNKVPLRKGPGTRFKKNGLASKGETFRFLREVQENENAPIWYLVEDREGHKHFIPKLFADLIAPEPPRKAETEETGGEPGAPEEEEAGEKLIVEQVRKSAQLDPENVRHVIDPTPPVPEELRKAKHISLNFEGTDIYDVITTFAELLKLDYIIEGNVQGKLTLQTFNQIPAEDLFPVFEQILAVSNVTVLKSGNFYRFVPMPEAPRKPLSIYYGNDPTRPEKDRVVIQIIPLRYVTNAAMRQVITPLLSANAVLLDVPDTRNLMLIDLSSNVNKVMKVIQAIDIDKLAASDIRLYEMQHSDATVVSEELKEIFTSMGYKKALDESLTFLPITRLNALLVVNSLEDVMETVEFWVDKLDQPMSGGNLSTFVYYVQNAEADRLAGILNSIFADTGTESRKEKRERTREAARRQQQQQQQSQAGQAASAGGGLKINPRTGQPQPAPFRVEGGIQSQVEGELTIIPDQDTNSLVIRTAAKNYPGVLELIKKLDLLPQQVVIEVMILDLTIDEQTRTGLEWALRGSDNNGYEFAGNVSGQNVPFPPGNQLGAEGTTLLGAALGGAATPIFAGGASFFTGKVDRLIALLQAFASDSKANIVANPILVTSDNKEATISITDDIPIQSSVITSPTAGQPLTQSTIEFRSVGVKLGILPKINSDNFVNLKINQEISNRGAEVQGTPSFQTRVVNTEVVLKDNQMLVMGGLMRTNTTETITGVPLLKDIPWIGRFFSTVNETQNKTELMLFITPHIISNTPDGVHITDHFRRRLGNLRSKFQRTHRLPRLSKKSSK